MEDPFSFGDEESPVVFKPDPLVRNMGSFAIPKEDHTIGNLLRMSLLADKRVRFAGYRMQPQIDNQLLIKLRTRSVHHPVQVFSEHLAACHQQLKEIERAFEVCLYAYVFGPNSLTSNVCVLQEAEREVVGTAAKHAVPSLAMSEAL